LWSGRGNSAPEYTKFFDYELELAAIIGKKGKEHPEGGSSRLQFGFYPSSMISAPEIDYSPNWQNEFGTVEE